MSMRSRTRVKRKSPLDDCQNSIKSWALACPSIHMLFKRRFVSLPGHVFQILFIVLFEPEQRCWYNQVDEGGDGGVICAHPITSLRCRLHSGAPGRQIGSLAPCQPMVPQQWYRHECIRIACQNARSKINGQPATPQNHD